MKHHPSLGCFHLTQIAVAIGWLWAVDGIRPSAWDVADVAAALTGMGVIAFQPRSSLRAEPLPLLRLHQLQLVRIGNAVPHVHQVRRGQRHDFGALCKPIEDKLALTL